MCLSNVYIQGDGERDLLCEYVTSISVMDGDVRMTDIAGGEISVAGSIQSVDLIKNTVVICRPE
ncbi:MAG: CooT family nickel-binding protein [Clostridiales bacterium]|nr:CooT family nickel-binding protein [Clostridiales bacterium]